MGEAVQIEGLKELLNAIDNVPKNVNDKLLFSVNRRVLTMVVKNPIKAAMPFSQETKKAVKVVRARGRDKTAVYVGPTTDAFYIRFFEKGTAERYTNAGVYKGSMSKGNTGIPGAIDAGVNEVIEEVKTSYGELYADSLAKYLKKFKKF